MNNDIGDTSSELTNDLEQINDFLGGIQGRLHKFKFDIIFSWNLPGFAVGQSMYDDMI